MECICEPGKTSDWNCGHCYPPRSAAVIDLTRYRQQRGRHRRPEPVRRVRVVPSGRA